MEGKCDKMDTCLGAYCYNIDCLGALCGGDDPGAECHMEKCLVFDSGEPAEKRWAGRGYHGKGV